ncbi:hypothetical protein ACWGAN_21620 [Streptomyces sp. NPDC054945]
MTHILPARGRMVSRPMSTSEVGRADWDTFRADHPGVSGSAGSLAERLPAAPAPTFDGRTA